MTQGKLESQNSEFKKGDKFILELGEERRMFDEFEIAGTDLYVRKDLLEKLTPYTPSTQPELCEDAVSRGVYEQTKWERDMAIQQLSDLGYGLGEKIREREDDQQLNEAIKKYAELADYQKEVAEWWDESFDEYDEVKRDDYLKWSREHKQVANWLMELKRLRALIPCEDETGLCNYFEEIDRNTERREE